MSVTFTVTLRTEATGAYRRLRRLLKTALRRDRLRAIEMREHAASRVSCCRTAQAARKSKQARRKGKTMKLTQYAGSQFIGEKNVQDRPFRGTVAKVVPGDFGKPVIVFASGHKFSCNKTNVGILIEAFGDESDDLIGEKIELYLGTARFNNEDRPSVVVRPLPRQPDEKKIRPPKAGNPLAGDLDDDIPF